MAIITLAEVKAILQITATTYDTLIGILIPIAEAKYLEIRNIPFFTFEATITSGSGIIDLYTPDDFKKINIQDKIETRDDSGVKLRGLATYLDTDDVAVTVNANSTTTESEAELVVYPGSADYTLSKMIDYYMNRDNASGYKSETFGTYNYTKFDIKNELPRDITGLIDSYQSGWC